MADKEFPLSLVIRAVDRATAPLKRINDRMRAITAPVRRLNNSFRALANEAGIPRLMKGFRGVGSAVGRVGSEARALGTKVAVMAGVAGFALFNIAKGAINAGDELKTMADRVGMSATRYAQYQFAADQADVSSEEFAGAMNQLNKRLGEAKAGGGSLLGFLKKVSPALAAQVKGASSTEEAFELMAGAMGKITDPSKRAALAAAAFGKSGLGMADVLKGGTPELERQKKAFLELAGPQDKFAEGASSLDNAIKKVGEAFGGLRSSVMGELFPVFEELARTLTRFIVDNREGIAKWATEAAAAIRKWMDEGGIEELIDGLSKMRKSIGEVVDMLGGLKGVAMAVAAVMGAPLVAAVVSLGGSLFSLASAALPLLMTGLSMLGAVLGKILMAFLAINLANPLTWIIAGVAALTAGAVALYKNWEPFRNLVDGVWGTIKEIASSPLAALKTAKDFYFGGDKAKPLASDAMKEIIASKQKQQSSEAHVMVDFNNAPRGANVSIDPRSSASIETNMSRGLGPSTVGIQ